MKRQIRFVLLSLLFVSLLMVPVGAQINGNEPLVISSPGQYLLDHNRMVSGMQGIVINSSDVLIDGEGFQIVGTSISGSTGIIVHGPLRNVTVRNLSVLSWGTGVRYQSVDVGRVDGVTARNCTENGFLIEGCRGICLEDCLALQNGYPGIAVTGSNECRLTDDRALLNNDVGIYLLNTTGTQIDRCAASENRMNGFYLEESTRTTIDTCRAAWNRYPGIAVNGGAQNLITRNLLYGNDIAGMYIEGTQRACISNNAAGGSPVGLVIINGTDRVSAGGNRWLTEQQEQVTRAGSLTHIPALGPPPSTLHALAALEQAAEATVRTGHRVDVGDGRQMALQTSGTGGPVVVLVAGTGDAALSWSLVQQQVGAFTTAVSIDRAGLGWSDPRTGPAEPTADVEDLHRALHNAGLPQPYLMVGEGRGATLVRLYAHRFPGEVSGLVLVEPESESEFSSASGEYAGARHQQIADLVRRLDMAERGVDSGYLARNPGLIPVDTRLSLQDQKTYRALLVSHPAFTQTWAREVMETDQLYSAVSAELRGVHPTVPVRVILAADPGGAGNRTLTDLQKNLAGTSTNGEVVTLNSSTRSPQLDRADEVTAVIRQLVKERA